MTHAAIGELSGVHVITRLEFASSRELVGGWKPVHVEHFLSRSEESLRLTMAIETPLHVECLLLPHQRHLIHRTMARGAANAFVHVNAVVEENEVGQIVDSRPAKPFVADEALAHRREHRRITPHLGMTSHAGFGGGNAGECRGLHGRVTKPAIQTKSADVMFVTERNRLIAWNSDPGGVGRPIDGIQRPAACDEQQDSAHERSSRD